MLESAVVAVPSLAESFGRTVLEALAARTPVVASDVGGPAEILTDGTEGFLVPAGDAESLARALDAALDPEANRVLAAAARATFEQRFELRTRVARIADWLEGRADDASS